VNNPQKNLERISGLAIDVAEGMLYVELSSDTERLHCSVVENIF